MSTKAPEEIMDAMHELLHLARAAQRQRMPDDGLHPMEGRALGFFVRHPGGTQRELVQHSGRDKGQVARLIASLRDKGLLVAEPDAEDRRVTRLYPSESALALHGQVMAERKAVAADALTGLSAEDKRNLLRMLDHMQTRLSAQVVKEA
ncbi:MarR family winged helix-turn-helix transcriptional regulator [Hydrogenophaga sp. 5NK40-0174]|uniref:MarR family winged helix-turn-helix transcriptional regulator n=1 Tax=Hydrogenophaga sp. 5NK40-0174 TaxID=3127649 RepID=UPI0031020632